MDSNALGDNAVAVPSPRNTADIVSIELRNKTERDCGDVQRAKKLGGESEEPNASERKRTKSVVFVSAFSATYKLYQHCFHRQFSLSFFLSSSQVRGFGFGFGSGVITSGPGLKLQYD